MPNVELEISERSDRDDMEGLVLNDRYEIVVEVGRGGRGVVYLAHDRALDREVAVKVVRQERLTKEDEARFSREARATAKLDHPAIVSIYDLCHFNGGLFLVMPYLRGDNLRVGLERLLDQRSMIEVAAQVAEALADCHRQGIVHRDIKPENIMLQGRPNGFGYRIKLVDFGLALHLGDERLTEHGALTGTLAYLSPEQVTMEGDNLTSATDVYSLGVVLYEGLVGETPFIGDWQTLLYQVAHVEPKTPSEHGVDLEQELEQLILRCLHKEPDIRPTAKQLAAALRSLLAGPHEAWQEVPSTPRKPTQNRRVDHLSLVSRRHELVELENRLEAAKDGECQLVMIGGEAGVGKTAMIHQLEEVIRRQSILCLRGGFEDIAQGIFPYQAYCEALFDGLRQRHAEGFAASHELEVLAPDLLRLFPGMRSLPGLEDLALLSETPPAAKVLGTSASRTSKKRDFFEILARAFGASADGHPMVVILEDLHLANVSIEVLHYLFRRLGPTPLLIVGTYRSDEVDRHHPLVEMSAALTDDPRVAFVRLSALSASESRQLIDQWLTTWSPHVAALEDEVAPSRPTIDESSAQVLHQTTAGNPLHLQELLRSLLTTDDLRVGEDGVLTLVLPAEDSLPSLPGSVQLTVSRRLASLDRDALDVLVAASILGHQFDVSALSAVALSTPSEKMIDDLIEAGFLIVSRRHQGCFELSSQALRRVIYGDLSARRRRNLHRRAAHYLERQLGERAGTASGRLSQHYALADEAEPAIRHGLIAARQALAAHCLEDAMSNLQLLLDFLDDEGEEGGRDVAAEVYALLAEVLRLSDRSDEALDEIDRADRALRRTSQRQSPRRHSPDMLWTAAKAARQLNRFDEAWRWTDLGIEALAQGDQPTFLRRFLRLGEEIHQAWGHPQQAAELRRRAESLRQEGGQSDSGSDSGSGYAERLGDLLLVQGDYLAARDAFDAARLERRNTFGELSSKDEARYLERMAELALKLGRYEQALEHCQLGIELVAEEDGEAMAGLEALAGRVECSAGRFEQAAAWVERGLARLRGSSEDDGVACRDPLGRLCSGVHQRIMAQLFRTQGNVLLGQGQPTQASTAFEQGRQLFERLEDRWEHSIALFNLAEASIQLGDYAAASGYLTAAAIEKSAIGDRWGLAYTHGARAWIHLDRGEDVAARREVATGLELARSLDDPKVVAWLHILSGRTHLLKGEIDDAESEMQSALAHAERTQAGPELVQARLGMSAVHCERGLFRRAQVAAEWAHRRAVESSEREAMLAASVALGRVARVVGKFAEASRWFRAALQLAEDIGNPYRICEVLSLCGETTLRCGNHRGARDDFERMHRLAEHIPDQRLVSIAELCLAEVSLLVGDEEATLDFAQSALRTARKLALPNAMGSVYELLTRHFVQVAQYRRAETYANAAIQIYSGSQEGDARSRGRVHLALAEMHLIAGNHCGERQEAENALRLLENSGDQAAWLDARRTSIAVQVGEDPEAATVGLAENIVASREAGYLLGEVRAQGFQCELLRRLGRIDEAMECARQEERLLRRIAHRKWLAVNAFHFASLYLEAGDFGRALHAGGLNFEPADNVGSMGRLFGLELGASLLLQIGRYRKARNLLDEAFHLAEKSDHPWRLANVHLVRAELFLASGGIHAAREEQSKGSAIAALLPDTNLLWYGYLVAERLEVLSAKLALAKGQPRRAVDVLEEPLRVFAELRTPLEEIDASLVLATAQLQLQAPKTACELLESIASRSREKGLVAREADALFLLGRASSDIEIARRSYRLAVRTGSWLRIARAARLVAEMESILGQADRSVRSRCVAKDLYDRLRQEIEPECRRSAESYWRTWGHPSATELT